MACTDARLPGALDYAWFQRVLAQSDAAGLTSFASAGHATPIMLAERQGGIPSWGSITVNFDATAPFGARAKAHRVRDTHSYCHYTAFAYSGCDGEALTKGIVMCSGVQPGSLTGLSTGSARISAPSARPGTVPPRPAAWTGGHPVAARRGHPSSRPPPRRKAARGLERRHYRQLGRQAQAPPWQGPHTRAGGVGPGVAGAESCVAASAGRCPGPVHRHRPAPCTRPAGPARAGLRPAARTRHARRTRRLRRRHDGARHDVERSQRRRHQAHPRRAPPACVCTIDKGELLVSGRTAPDYCSRRARLRGVGPFRPARSLAAAAAVGR